MRETIIAFIVCLLAAFSAPAKGAGKASDAPSMGYVQRNGRNLHVKGTPLTLLGFNRYELAGGPQTGQCRKWGTQDQWWSWAKARIDDADALGANVIRLWAFQNFAGPSGKDFAALDKVIGYAKSKRIRTVLVLENTWADCTEGGIKGDAWFGGGHARPYGRYKLSFDSYLDAIVTRYRDDPAIAMWQVINEGKNWENPGAMQRFIASAARRIKAIDKNHLVSGGAAVQCWQARQGALDFKNYSSDAAIDVLDAHSYEDDHAPWPVCMSDALAAAAALQKPLIIGESGMLANKYNPQTRATLLWAQTQAALQHGVAGYLLWSLGEVDGAGDGFDVGPKSPSAAILQKARQSLRR